MQLTPEEILRNGTVAKCPLCKGQGFLLEHSGSALPTKNPNRKVSYAQAKLCICRKNELVENSSPYFNPRTTALVSEELARKFAETYDINQNIWFTGPDLVFFNLCKTVFVHHRQNPLMLLHITNGLDLLQDYYVEQTGANKERSIAELILGRDLLVVVCNTTAKNKALADVIVQVVNGRRTAGKGVWVWTPSNFVDMTEYSDTLQGLLNTWRTVALPNLSNSAKVSSLLRGAK